MTGAMTASTKRKWLDRVALLLLVVATTVTLQVGSKTQGYARDEGYYFHAAELHVAYLEESLLGIGKGKPRTFAERAVIDRYLSYNSEHPPLMKTLFGISWRLLHRCDCPKESGLHALPYYQRHKTLGLLSQGQAMRLPTHLLMGLLCAAVYAVGRRLFGRPAGLCAAALTLLSPRLFFHGQLSCFDAPVTAMIFLTTAVYLRAEETRCKWWALAAGATFGLAILTKLNAFFLPPVLLVHSLYTRRAELRGLRDPSLSGRERVQRALRYLVPGWALAMAVVGPLVFLAGWPYLWPDPLRRFGSYVAFHLHHVHYNIEYLGTNYNRPPYPWHYVPVVTLLTTPLTTLGLLCIGSVALTARGRQHASAAKAGLLLALGALWPMLLIMRPGTPIFGAEKHWLPSVPFLALLAGFGFAVVAERLGLALRLSRGGALVVAGALGLLCVTGPALEVRRSHPYGLSHYNALAGGPWGGATLGMNRQFWGYAARGIMPVLNQITTPGAVIYFHDANWFQLQMSMKDGFLRRDLRDSGIEEPGVRASDYGIVILEKHFNKYEYWLWDAYGTTRPTAVLTHEGVPLVTVYQRPETAASDAAGRVSHVP